MRWLRDAAGDPHGCVRHTVVDDADMFVQPRGHGLVELHVPQADRATRLADEFFGRRYETETDATGRTVFVGPPL